MVCVCCRRKTVQARLDAGEKPHFLPETRRVRESDWKVRLGGALGSPDIVISSENHSTAGMTALAKCQEDMCAHALAFMASALTLTAACIPALGGSTACL